MDKDKILKWLVESDWFYKNQIEAFEEAIQNGKFDKQPCEKCAKWEQYNIDANNYHEHYMDNPWFEAVNYCDNCGRQIEAKS